MKTLSAGIALLALLSLSASAGSRITAQDIQQVINATDDAAAHRDADRIGTYLGSSFEKLLEFTYKDYIARVRIDKTKYLQLIRNGWSDVQKYTYQRENSEIHVSDDGSQGQSWSTITEHTVRHGKEMVSKVREYATYKLENGKPVITNISGMTLVGDTSPVY